MDIDRTKQQCHFCGRFGHLKKDCRRRLGLCVKCGKSGHFGKDCPEKNVRGTQKVRRTQVPDKSDRATVVLKEESESESGQDQEEPSQGFVNDL